MSGMGRVHIPYAGTRVVAICDVDKNHLSEVAKMVGGGVKTFHEHQELIALPEINIVHIALPPLAILSQLAIEGFMMVGHVF